MSDLISRQAEIDALFDWEMTYDWDEYYREEDPKPAYIVSPSDVIEQLPSAQTEIIRCKDCKYWTHIKRTNRYWCKTDDGLFDLNPSPDDFCSRAERRTDDGE